VDLSLELRGFVIGIAWICHYNTLQSIDIL